MPDPDYGLASIHAQHLVRYGAMAFAAPGLGWEEYAKDALPKIAKAMGFDLVPLVKEGETE